MRTMRRHGDRDSVILWIRDSDPIRKRLQSGWSSSPEADAVLRQILSGRSVQGGIVLPSARRRAGRTAVLALAILLGGAGVAGATRLLGGPAPDQVRRDIGSLDQGMPPDLRYNPDVANAQLVAQADGARLYFATLKDGGYCSEIVTTDSGPRGAVCTTSSLASEPIQVSVPFVDPLTKHSPLVVGGRVNVAVPASLDAVFSDGERQSVPLGMKGFFLFAVATEHLVVAHEEGFSLIAYDSNHAPIASTEVPGTDFSEPESQDRRQPIFVSTISTEDDFTKVLGVEGSVNVERAVSLELRYPDGTTVSIPLTTDGRYHYILPRDRVGDLYPTPGWLIARDASGAEVARAPVGAVAAWRASG